MTAVKEIKEEFCGACLAAPLAILGVGAAGVGTTKGGHNKTKKVMLWVGVSITILSLIITLFFMFTCSKCG
jgi:hypothetical protein